MWFSIVFCMFTREYPFQFICQLSSLPPWRSYSIAAILLFCRLVASSNVATKLRGADCASATPGSRSDNGHVDLWCPMVTPSDVRYVSWFIAPWKIVVISSGWWFQPLWKILYSQLGWLFPINGKNVPNHQPVMLNHVISPRTSPFANLRTATSPFS
jgi:hypothetical protein